MLDRGGDTDGARRTTEFDGHFRDLRRESEFLFDALATTVAVAFFWGLSCIQKLRRGVSVDVHNKFNRHGCDRKLDGSVFLVGVGVRDPPEMLIFRLERWWNQEESSVDDISRFGQSTLVGSGSSLCLRLHHCYFLHQWRK